MRFCLVLVPVPTTKWIMALVIILTILLLLGHFALFCFACETSRRRELCCWAQKKNVNKRPADHDEVPLNMPPLPGKWLSFSLFWILVSCVSWQMFILSPFFLTDQPADQLKIYLPKVCITFNEWCTNDCFSVLKIKPYNQSNKQWFLCF